MHYATDRLYPPRSSSILLDELLGQYRPFPGYEVVVILVIVTIIIIVIIDTTAIKRRVVIETSAAKLETIIARVRITVPLPRPFFFESKRPERIIARVPACAGAGKFDGETAGETIDR